MSASVVQRAEREALDAVHRGDSLAVVLRRQAETLNSGLVPKRTEHNHARSKHRVWVLKDNRGHWAVWLFAPGRSRFITSNPDWSSSIEFAQLFARTYATKTLIR